MNPTIELRIRTMIRALTEVIIPAVDTNNSLAQEQAGLLIGHLYALLQHEGREQVMCDMEYAALRELANALIAASAGGNATMEATSHLQALPDDVDTDTLSHAIETLIIESGIDGDEGFKQASESLVIEHAYKENLRSRIWFKAMGFDHDPDSLPDIDSLFT